VVPQRVPAPAVGFVDLGTNHFGGDLSVVAAGGFGVVGDGVDGEVLPALGCLLPGQQGFDELAADLRRFSALCKCRCSLQVSTNVGRIAVMSR
jgi:hypothetical protein